MAAPTDIEQAETLAEAITLLRWQLTDRPGRGPLSHDKFAALVGATRMSVISWEKGTWPRDYLGRLGELGIPARLLERDSPVSRKGRLEALEAEVARLREERDELLVGIVGRLGDLEAGLERVEQQQARHESQAGHKRAAASR